MNNSPYSARIYTDTQTASIEEKAAAAAAAAVQEAKLRDTLEGPITHYIIKASTYDGAGFGRFTSDHVEDALITINDVIGLEFVSDYNYKIPANQISKARKGILLGKNELLVRFEILREIRTPNTASTGGRRRTHRTRRVKRKGTKAKKTRQSRKYRR